MRKGRQKKGNASRGRPRICQDPRSQNATFEATTLHKLQDRAREERRSVPDLIRLAVEAFLDPQNVTLSLDSALSNQLEAISRADPNGRLSNVQMARQAIAEYVNARCSRPEVQQVLASMGTTGLRLVDAKRRIDDSDRSSGA